MRINFNFLKRKKQPAAAPQQPATAPQQGAPPRAAPSEAATPAAAGKAAGQKEILKRHKELERQMRKAVRVAAKPPSKPAVQQAEAQAPAAAVPLKPGPEPVKPAREPLLRRLLSLVHHPSSAAAPPSSVPVSSSSSQPSQDSAKRAAAAAALAKEAQRKRAADERALERARRQLQKRKSQKKKGERRTAQQQRRVLGNLLVKAGFSVRPERLQKTVFYVTIVVIALCSLLTLSIAAVSGKAASDILLFSLGLWTAVFAFVYLFIWMAIYLYLDIRIYRRVQELEEVLPDFLQLASANISAGMPIDRALWFAVRPNFGVLAKEIEEVAKATLAGEELSESLNHFTEKYDSPTLRRSISILLEGVAAGGEIAELLNKIALNIQETKILRKEMSANVATYAIFITFASIVMAPILFALATELLTIIVKITSTIDLSGSTSSFLTLNIKTTPQMITNFRWFSVLMLTISALMSASIVSVIRKGKVKDGVRNLPIFLAVSLLIYFLACAALGTLLGGLIA